MTRAQRKIVLEAIQAEYEREVKDLFRIAKDAGDTTEAAADWVSQDSQVNRLRDFVSWLKQPGVVIR